MSMRAKKQSVTMRPIGKMGFNPGPLDWYEIVKTMNVYDVVPGNRVDQKVMESLVKNKHINVYMVEGVS